MGHLRRAILSALAAMWLGALSPAQAGAPKVVVSILPLHALVAQVMAGVATPLLLLRGSASPHSYSLKLSQARSLDRADVVFWIGGGLETFLQRPLASLAAKARVEAMVESAGLELLPLRGAPKLGHDAFVDAHVWLDPANARRMLARIEKVLSALDPAHGARYASNRAAASARLDRLEREIVAQLALVQRRPFVVLHDAYQYFERAFGLEHIGALSVSAERRPGARHMQALRRRMSELGARCLFRESQLDARLAQALAEGTGVRIALMDPLGAGLPPGPGAYAALMRAMATTMATCLARDD